MSKSANHSAGPSGGAGLSPAAVPGVNDSAPATIQKLEQRLFFKTFPEDQLSARLDRIEKQVFGEPLKMADSDRLAKLDEVLRQEEESDRKKQESEALRNSMQAGSNNRSGSGAGLTTGRAGAGSSFAGGESVEMDRARTAIQAAREEEISGLLADGVKLYRSKRGVEAQEKFEQALRLDPHNAEAHFNLGIIEESMGNYVEAYSSYKQAADAQPDNQDYSEAVRAVGKKAERQNQISGERVELKQLAEQANGAWMRGEYISALDLYKQLDAKEPNKALVKYNIGSIYLMMKDQKQALENYKLAHKLEPGNSKYSQAYKELSETVARVEKAQDKIDNETQREYSEAQNPSQKKGRKSSGRTTASAPNGRNNGIANSPFAPMMVVGGTPKMNNRSNSVRPAQPQNRMPANTMMMRSGGMNGMAGGGINGMTGGGMTGMTGGGMAGMTGGGMSGMAGMNSMAGGTNGMAGGMNGMAGGMNGMAGGMNGMSGGMNGMAGGMNGMAGGMNGMAGGMNSMAGGMNSMAGGMNSMSGGMNGMAGGMNGMAGGMNGMAGGMNGMASMNNITGGMTGMASGMNNMPGGMGRSSFGVAPGMVNTFNAPQVQQQVPTFAAMSSYGIAGRTNGQGVTVTNIGMASRASSAGLLPGDDIRAVDGIQVSQPEEINNILARKNPSERITVVILRGGNMAVINL